MSKLAVIYWSGTGNTGAMAEAVLQGAKAAGADAQLFEVSEVSAPQAAEFDALALGCPAMGAEVLEESEFEPFYTELVGSLSGKKVVLFGSYGWGDGQWMRDWEKSIIDSGAILVGEEGLIINEAPDDDGIKNCLELGKKIAQA